MIKGIRNHDPTKQCLGHLLVPCRRTDKGACKADDSGPVILKGVWLWRFVIGRNVTLPAFSRLSMPISLFVVSSSFVTTFWMAPPRAVSIAVSYF